MTCADMSEAIIRDLHTTVQLQHRQVVHDGRAGTQATDTFVSDTATI